MNLAVVQFEGIGEQCVENGLAKRCNGDIVWVERNKS